MTNHYHVVVETVEGNLSQGMRHLNGVYTQRHNRRHGRVGHVFQGRYTGLLVERDTYLLELSRYVVLNPVRAGMVTEAGEWPWSSYRPTVGLPSPRFDWHEKDWLLSQFGHNRRSARMRYINFVRDGIGLPSIWSDLRSQLYLGSDRVVQEMAERVGDSESLSEIPKAQRRPMPHSLDYYERSKDNRVAAMADAYATGSYTMQEIALHFGVHYSSVSRAVRQSNKMRDCKT